MGFVDVLGATRTTGGMRRVLGSGWGAGAGAGLGVGVGVGYCLFIRGIE